MVLQKIIFQIFLDNKDIVFVFFVLNMIYRVLRRDHLYHNLGLSIISNFSLIDLRGGFFVFFVRSRVLLLLSLAPRFRFRLRSISLY